MLTGSAGPSRARSVACWVLLHCSLVCCCCALSDLAARCPLLCCPGGAAALSRLALLQHRSCAARCSSRSRHAAHGRQSCQLLKSVTACSRAQTQAVMVRVAAAPTSGACAAGVVLPLPPLQQAPAAGSAQPGTRGSCARMQSLRASAAMHSTQLGLFSTWRPCNAGCAAGCAAGDAAGLRAAITPRQRTTAAVWARC